MRVRDDRADWLQRASIRHQLDSHRLAQEILERNSVAGRDAGKSSLYAPAKVLAHVQPLQKQ